jgi:phage terminase large subunit
MNEITLPHNWEPRAYQLPVLQHLDSGGKRAVTVWARRHGKDNTAINHTARAAFKRVGLYWHILPTLRQARKSVWNGIDKQGRRNIHQAFPGAANPDAPGGIVKRVRDDDMLIEFKNGSMWQCVGADSHDALVGSNPIGVVLSEWSLMDPKVYDFIRPILMENEGWCWFIYTPRGRNHGWKIYDMARNNPTWFAEVVDIRTAGVLDVEMVLAEERASGMPEEMIQQEYFCSFDVGTVGTIFAKEISKLEEQGKITSVPYDPNFPVETSWDLGVRDSTAIWFFQRVGAEIRVIDYYENRGEGLPHYVNEINKRNYAYARHIGPHDLEQREWGAGMSKRLIAELHGIVFEVAPKLRLEDQINASRGLLPRCVFDKVKTESGLDALKNYKYEYDEDKRVFGSKPVHDWASHGSSAFNYYAVMPELELLQPAWVKQLLAERKTQDKRNKSGWQPKEDLATAEYDPLGGFR